MSPPPKQKVRLVRIVRSQLFELLCEQLFGALEGAEQLAAIEGQIIQRDDKPDVLFATAAGQLMASEFDTSIGPLLLTYFYQGDASIHLIALVPVPKPTDLELILRLSILGPTLVRWAYQLVATHPEAAGCALAAASALGHQQAQACHVLAPQ